LGQHIYQKYIFAEEIANLHEQYDLQTVVVDKDKRGSIVGRNGAFIKQWDKDHGLWHQYSIYKMHLFL
jgi:hypothetical protein